MRRTPPMPPLRPKTLAQQESDFTSEGAPLPDQARPGSAVETPGSIDEKQPVLTPSAP